MSSGTEATDALLVAVLLVIGGVVSFSLPLIGRLQASATGRVGFATFYVLSGIGGWLLG